MKMEEGEMYDGMSGSPYKEMEMMLKSRLLLLGIWFLLVATSTDALKLERLGRFVARGSICLASCFVCMPTQMACAKLTEEGVNRFINAKAELDDLDTNWDKISGKSEANPMGLGDNIRRKLGTVYTPPKCDYALCSFESFTKSFLKDNFEDLDMDSFEDLVSPLNNALGQAEFLAYSANFNEFSSAKPAGLVLMYSCT